MNELEKLKARMADILNEIQVFETVENISDEQVETINALHGEYEQVKAKSEALEKVASIQNHATTSTRKSAPVNTPSPKVEVKSRFDKTMGFKNFGEFAKAVADKSKGKVDERFNNSAAYEHISEDGGVLIPSDFLSEIREKAMGDDSLLPRTSNFQVSGNHLSMPIDEKEPWNGGIKAYWIGEGQQYTESKQELGQANFRLHKLGALVRATDELLEDASALESYIRRKAPEAIVHKLNDAIINGDGVAKPSGILGSDFTIEVAAEGGQAADTVVYKNLVNMEARLLPSASAGAVWIAHPAVKAQLRQLKDDNGNAIYMSGGQFPNLASAGFDTLLGKPIVYMMGAMPTLGDSGDIILADLNYYYSAIKTAGIRQDISTHLYFDRDITAFKFSMRVDGHCPFKSPVVTQYGNYEMSGFIKLAAR
jgi:HK97 family phage major capsid protein